MKDDAFLQLPPAEARQFANFAGQPEEARLKALYLERKGVDLDKAGIGTIPAVSEAAETPSDGSTLRGWGLLFVAAGVITVIGSFYFDVGVGSGSGGLYGIPERVANIDKVAIREMILASGLTLFVSGWILFASGCVVGALRRP